MQQDKLIVILADLSGYTRFMLENRTSAVHGQMCINSLIESILSHVDIPLVLQEIEGDAVFLYARDPGSPAGWKAIVEEVSLKLHRFFEAFIAQTGAGAAFSPCGCAICRNADKLGLKIVVHAGEAVFHQVAGRPQVSCPDVILAHRLLKNSVDAAEYLLLSEAAYELMGHSLPGTFATHAEHYEGFGQVTTKVRLLEREMREARDAVYQSSNAERDAALNQYQDWVVQHIGSAAVHQAKFPIRPFSVFERTLMLWDALVGYRMRSAALRDVILARLKARGTRPST